MYRTVEQLTQPELDELKEDIFWNHPKVAGDNYPWEIPNDVVFRFFEGIDFVEEDFFCNV